MKYQFRFLHTNRLYEESHFANRLAQWPFYPESNPIGHGQMDGKKLASDYSIINYARENDMIIVTKDVEFRKASEENNFPLILLDNEEILKMIVEKLKFFS